MDNHKQEHIEQEQIRQSEFICESCDNCHHKSSCSDLEGDLRWIIMTWLQEAVVKKIITGSLDKVRLEIVFPKFKSLDEEKTARADKINLADEATSQQRVQEQKGEDYEDLQDQLTQEDEDKVRREAKGLKIKQDLEKELGIEFPIEGKIQERETEKRSGETDATEEDDKKERRKSDGNN